MPREPCALLASQASDCAGGPPSKLNSALRGAFVSASRSFGRVYPARSSPAMTGP
jgi:hypothetical protein